MHGKYVLTQTLPAVLATCQEEANNMAAGVRSLTPAPGGGREQVLIFGHTQLHNGPRLTLKVCFLSTVSSLGRHKIMLLIEGSNFK